MDAEEGVTEVLNGNPLAGHESLASVSPEELLPDSLLDDDSDTEDVFVSDAQRHWDENMKVLENALFLVLAPVIGRVLGRKAAQNIWISYVEWRASTHKLQGH